MIDFFFCKLYMVSRILRKSRLCANFLMVCSIFTGLGLVKTDRRRSFPIQRYRIFLRKNEKDRKNNYSHSRCICKDMRHVIRDLTRITKFLKKNTLCPVEQIEHERRTSTPLNTPKRPRGIGEPPNAPVRNPREIISISDDSTFEEFVKYMNWSSMYEDESKSGPGPSGPVHEGANEIVEESNQEHVSSCMEVT
nr:uncharacterized protein LOC105330844 isoform X2 [Crassostrea gigas]